MNMENKYIPIKSPELAWSKRKKFENPDECYTPEEAILPLLEYLKKDNLIWDCAYGSGRLAENFNKYGFNVVGNINYDFLKEDSDKINNFDIIITNPPYSLKDKFLKRAFKIGKPFCFLLPTKAIGEEIRGALFKKYGIQIIIPDERINFEIPSLKKSSWFHTSWFCHGLHLEHDLNFVNLNDLRTKYGLPLKKKRKLKI